MDERKIVACVDRSQYSIAVADCAAWVSRQIKAPVEFLHVIDRHLEQGSGEDHSGAIGFDAQENLLNKLLSNIAPSPRQPSVSSTPAPATPVGWNCQNSMSSRGMPARAAMPKPSPVLMKALVEAA